MSLAVYQKQVDDWLQQYETPYWEPLSQLARLTEEVGELAKVYNHTFGQKPKKPTEEPDDMAGEMGDILFGLICMANDQGIDLDAVMRSTMHKVQTRDKDRFQRKENYDV